MSVCAALSFMGAIAGLVLPGRHGVVFSQTQAKEPEIRKSEAYGALEHSPLSFK
jgi:hypothetical protein